MVDDFLWTDFEDCDAALAIADDNIFCSGGVLREPGLIEHVAQSAAASAGYAAYLRGKEPSPGYIGEVKKFHILQLPKVGETLHTHLHVLGSAAGASLLYAEVKDRDVLIAQGNMKIFLKED